MTRLNTLDTNTLQHFSLTAGVIGDSQKFLRSEVVQLICRNITFGRVMLDNDLIEVIAASLVEIIVAEVEMLLAFFVNSVEFEVDCISNWNSFQEHSLKVKGVDKVVPQKLGAPRKLLII